MCFSFLQERPSTFFRGQRPSWCLINQRDVMSSRFLLNSTVYPRPNFFINLLILTQLNSVKQSDIFSCTSVFTTEVFLFLLHLINTNIFILNNWSVFSWSCFVWPIILPTMLLKPFASERFASPQMIRSGAFFLYPSAIIFPSRIFTFVILKWQHQIRDIPLCLLKAHPL